MDDKNHIGEEEEYGCYGDNNEDNEDEEWDD